jgi:hypothetical protein
MTPTIKAVHACCSKHITNYCIYIDMQDEVERSSTIGLSHYQNPGITSFRLLGPCSCCGSIRTVLTILPRGNRGRSHSSDSATAYNLSPEYMQLEKELVGMTRSSWYPSIDKMCGCKTPAGLIRREKKRIVDCSR